MDQVFKNNPALKVYYKTSDSTAFYNESDAKLHAKTLDDKKVEPIFKSVLEKVVNALEDIKQDKIQSAVASDLLSATQTDAEKQAQKEVEEQAKKDAELQAQKEAEEQAQKEAEEQAEKDAELQAQKEAEAQAQKEAPAKANKVNKPKQK